MAPYTDTTFSSLRSIGIDNIHPLAAGCLVEGAARNDNGLFGLAELDIQVVGLAGADVLGLLAFEAEIGLEFAFADFGIDFADDRRIFLVLTLESRLQARCDSVNVMFIYLGFNLIRIQIIDLADFGTCCH